MSKNRLIERLKWYYPLERFHTFVTFPVLILKGLYTYSLSSTVFLTYGLIVCTIILYQGQHYWKLKLKKLEGVHFDNQKQLRFFNSSKKLNIVLIALIPVVFIFQLSIDEWSFNNRGLLFWGLLANVFAVLEHINYFHTQLMIDNKYDLDFVITNKKLKKSSLAKDLQEGEI